MITCSSFSWPDMVAIAVVVVLCVASIIAFMIGEGGRK